MSWLLILIIGGAMFTNRERFRDIEACVAAGEKSQHEFICVPNPEEGEPV